MKFEEFKAEFDSIFANTTDQEFVDSFAKMGCEVVPIPRDPALQSKLDKLWLEGREAWADVPDPDVWVDALRNE